MSRLPSDVAGGRLSSLAAAARGLAEVRSLDEVIDNLSEQALFAFDASTVSLLRLDRDGDLVRVLASAGDLDAADVLLRSGGACSLSDLPISSLASDSARPWLLDQDDESIEAQHHALLRRLGASSALGAPVLVEGRVWGELLVTRGDERPAFTEDDLGFAVAFSGLVASGVAQAEQLHRMERLAYQDPLTGLANRRAVEDRLRDALLRSEPDGPPVSVVMGDVNRLKAANDRHGHAAGDAALIAVANALATAAAAVPGALAGRLGGDEFCVVLDGQDTSTAVALARDFLSLAAGAPYGVGVACGVASTEGAQGRVSPAQLFAWADEAQYEAKRGRAIEPVVGGHPDGRTRRRFRGRQEGIDALARALAVAGQHQADSVDVRTAATIAALAFDVGAAGWVLSLHRSGVAVPLAFGSDREGVLSDASVPAPASADWVIAAGVGGAVVHADDDVPLAAVRGCAVVVVAAADGWIAELLLDEVPNASDLAATLRAVLAVAVLG